MKRKHSWLVLAVYLLFTLAPIYWMLHMSLRSNPAITSHPTAAAVAAPASIGPHAISSSPVIA